MIGNANSYSLPVVASVLLHSALIAIITWGWTPEKQPRKISTPRYIEAKLLQLAPPVAPPKIQAKVKPKVDTAAVRRAEKSRQEKIKEERVKKEQARQKKLKAKAERLRKEALADELKRKQQMDRQRQEMLRQQRAKELANALRNEDEFLDASENEKQVGSFIGYIQNKIEANWSRPPSARLGMNVELAIQLDGRARVISVMIVESSGNGAFDRSAEQAVHQAGQFERLLELSNRSVFERNFRRFRLLFNPEDLRL